MKDNLKECVCSKKSNMLYETNMGQLTSWSCVTCGFQSNNMLIKDSELQIKYEESLPELYKDLSFVDDKGYAWYPCVLNDTKIGIVFVSGTDKENWEWAGAKSVLISEEEKSRFPDGTTHKVDMSTFKSFGKEGYMDALEYVGYIK